jgi:hypothetical protein
MVMKGKRTFCFLVSLLAAASLAWAVQATAKPDRLKKANTMDEIKHNFTLSLYAEKSYLTGFPFIVAVEVRNVSPTLHDLLPYFDLLTDPGSARFNLRGEGRELTWRARSSVLDDEPVGMEFGPGQVWFALQDLSNQQPDIPPGHYQLTASIMFPGELVESVPANVEVVASGKTDHAIATRLRSANDDNAPSWRAFIASNWSTPDTHGFSAEGLRRLGLYLYLHKVAYGPRPVSALDPEEPWKFGHGILESEAALYRLEILRAAKRPQAEGIAAAILERWPSRAGSVAKVREDFGLLKRIRISYGADSPYVPKDKPRPYVKAR